METLINVGVAKLEISSRPSLLRTILGSCIGICIYDRKKKIGGLAHILLPEKKDASQLEKYADSAIPLLFTKLQKKGCTKENMTAKIAGGASMFKFKSKVSLGKIGENNIKKTKEILEEIGVPLVAEDVGGNQGRVVNFFLEDGRVKIKAGGKEKVYYKI